MTLKMNKLRPDSGLRFLILCLLTRQRLPAAFSPEPSHSYVEERDIVRARDRERARERVRARAREREMTPRAPTTPHHTPCRHTLLRQAAHAPLSTSRCRANMAHIRHSRPDSGLGFQVEVLQTFYDVLSSLGSAHWTEVRLVGVRRQVFGEQTCCGKSSNSPHLWGVSRVIINFTCRWFSKINFAL